ncbi:hypothetical protein D1872_306610 [compost metagenome]
MLAKPFMKGITADSELSAQITDVELFSHINPPFWNIGLMGLKGSVIIWLRLNSFNSVQHAATNEGVGLDWYRHELRL